MNRSPPCVLHEDEHIVIVAKPAGWNTHAPDDYLGEGIYEWLRDREPRWAELANLHRLDKDTSGLLVFAKSALARRSLARQFEARAVRKQYRMLTAGVPPGSRIESRACLARRGKVYVATADEGDEAVTAFAPTPPPPGFPPQVHAVLAEPVTGRTHQIRVQSAALGFPVLGDALYGGAPAPRLCLHAERLAFHHPGIDAPVSFELPADFAADIGQARRAALADPAETNTLRLVHGTADGWPGARVDRFDRWLLHQSAALPGPGDIARLESLAGSGIAGIYHKTLTRNLQRLDAEDASPRLVSGEPAPARFRVCENGIEFELSFEEGYSVGIFLDQRDNRRRLLAGHVAAKFPLPGIAGGTVLNTFAYTCAFSVAAALAGATVTSLDLSKKYLEWGRRNFTLNGLDAGGHDFIYGDAFDWLRRLAKKGRRFDIVLLDPPTFSQSKEHGVFRAESDYGRLVSAALAVLAPGGVLFAASNAARLEPAGFIDVVREAVHAAGRRIECQYWAAQPPDFPISRDEPAYLKGLWLRLG